MKPFFLLLLMIVSISLVMHKTQTHAQTAAIANVTLPFGGNVAGPEEARRLIKARMESFAPDASGLGITGIHLQSVAYTIVPADGGYRVDGNLFIDTVPESKTTDFVALLKKKGVEANINYFQRCVPPQR